MLFSQACKLTGNVNSQPQTTGKSRKTIPHASMSDVRTQFQYCKRNFQSTVSIKMPNSFKL